MEVILLADVEKVGLRGDVVNVARGYARNFLLPRKLAEPATPARVAEVRRRDEERARQEARNVEQARAIGETLTKTVLRFEVRAGERGALFGSVTASDIADELWRTRKVRIDRRKIALPEPIKRVGRYTIPIEVFTGVTVDVKTLVVPEGGELPEEEPAGEGQAAELEEQVAQASGEPAAPPTEQEEPAAEQSPAPSEGEPA